MKSLSLFIIFLLVTSCASWKPFSTGDQSTDPSNSPVSHTLFFYGGSLVENDEAYFTSLAQEINSATNSTIIHLGNLSGRQGLPDSSSRRRAKAQVVINRQLSLLSGFSGNVILTPGFEDWAAGGQDGYNRVLNLESYLETFMQSENRYFSQGGCPGPVEIELTKDILLVTINTQWYLHGWNKPLRPEGCDLKEPSDLLINLDAILKRNTYRKVIVAGNHPIFSNGRYGGNYPLWRHLTPPVIGTGYILNRQLIGEKPDLVNPEYRQLRKSLRQIIGQYPHVVYLSGHEKSLQYHKDNDQHYLVSGALGDRNPVAGNQKASFAHPGRGFGKLIFHENGDVNLQFHSYSKDRSFEMAYSKLLYNKPSQDEPDLFESFSDVDFSGDSVVINANSQLGRKKRKPWLLGRNYRPEWTEEIKVPVFDLAKEKGGLRIIKKGGGAQTYSLRLEDASGKQWVLRSIRKYPEKAIVNALRGTVYSDILKDQVSASHPYGAFVVPEMAEAIGVYHTNPRIVYLPDDPRLGVFRDQLGGGLYLFEERPDDDWRDASSLGNSKNIIGSTNMIRRLSDGDHHMVDEHMVVKSRLFDLLLGDWDRHADQWRWASFKRDDYKFYQPIPRDRDQVFYNNDGAIVAVGSRKWISPQIRGFHHRIKFPERLAGNGIHFDRTFLHQLDRKGWVKASSEIRSRLTDEVIDNSLSQWPEGIQKWSADEIADKLKKRRDDLDTYAESYYAFLAQEVDVPGTQKRDRFLVDHLGNGQTRVQAFRVNKSGKTKFRFFDRTFLVKETREVRLFGLGHDDYFEIKGKAPSGVKLRVIGGDGMDTLDDQSDVRKGGKRTVVYDTPEGITINGEGEVKRRLERSDIVNRYDRKNFKYNRLYPLIFTESNPDDGLFIGGGFGLVKQGFRQNPSESHVLRAEMAPKSRSFVLNYSFFAADVIKNWDINTQVLISEPSFSDFFYGYGNRTQFDRDARRADGQFYRARYSQWILHPRLSNRFGNNKQHNVSLGLRYRSVKIRRGDNDGDANRFILSYDPAVLQEPDAFLNDRRNYLGATFDYSIDTRNNQFIPSRGFKWSVGTALVWQVDDERFNYQQINSNFSFYLGSGGPLNPVLAFRIGGTVNFGDFQFYQSARIGGTSNLRGYRKFRFAGDESIYQNSEFRLKLFNFKSRLFPGQIGINAFHDIGRVWTAQEDTDLVDNSLSNWHRGYGGGVWISPLGRVVINTEFTKSVDNDGLLIYLRLGFMF